jgi:predicted nuclease of predicted toxin-antitoxin system
VTGAEPTRDWQITDYSEREAAIVMSKDKDFIDLRLPERFAFRWLRCGNISNRRLREWLGRRWEDVEECLAGGAQLIALSD